MIQHEVVELGQYIYTRGYALATVRTPFPPYMIIIMYILTICQFLHIILYHEYTTIVDLFHQSHLQNHLRSSLDLLCC